MSGGSFNYLYLWKAWENIFIDTSIMQMVKHIREFDKNKFGDLANELENLSGSIEYYKKCIDKNLDKYEDVLKAYEFYTSGNWGEEDVIEAQEKMYEKHKKELEMFKHFNINEIVDRRRINNHNSSLIEKTYILEEKNTSRIYHGEGKFNDFSKDIMIFNNEEHFINEIKKYKLRFCNVLVFFIHKNKFIIESDYTEIYSSIFDEVK